MGKDRTNKKFTTFTAAGGSIDDFFKGLEDRIGAPNLDFKNAMCAEHIPFEKDVLTHLRRATTKLPLNRLKNGLISSVIRVVTEQNAPT